MKVRNNYTSHLGLGITRILPGETIELPQGYGENHPVVKWYISRGWLVIIGKGKAAKPANINVAINTGSINDDDTQDAEVTDDGNENADDETGEDDGTDDSDAEAISEPAKKNVDRLTLDELKTLASEMKLEVVETDTRKILIEKIKTVKKAEE